MSRAAKIWTGVLVYLLVAVLLYAIFGSDGKNEDFQPQNEFKLDPWVSIHIGGIDMSINKAVLYLFLACALTAVDDDLHRASGCRTGRTACRRSSRAPTTSPTRRSRAATCRDGTAAKWFPFVATLFFFIWFSNMLGYIPLPTNTQETIDIFGIGFPAFALYAATANLSIPLVLTLDGVHRSTRSRASAGTASIKYLKGWLPAGRRRRRRGPDLRHRGDLAVRPDHLALRPTVRQHPRRPPADPVHGRRARRAARARGARLDHAADRDRVLHLRGRPGGDPAGIHLRNAHIHLLRRGNRRRALRKEHRGPRTHTRHRQRPRRRPTASSRSHSASAPAWAPSAPASASATSSAR